MLVTEQTIESLNVVREDVSVPLVIIDHKDIFF